MKNFTTILTLLLLGTSVFAQNLSGTWTVKGENPKGDAYEGTLDINPVSKIMYKLNWDLKYANKSRSQTFPGTGIYDKETNKMIAAYGIGTLRFGLFQYELNEKGGLQGAGSWTSHQGRGAELLGGRLNQKTISGTYEVVGRRSKDDVEMGASETYKGTLKITKDGDKYHLTWYLGDGTPFSGFGYISGGSLIGVWGIGGSYGLEIYSFNKSMDKATSEWTTPNYDFKMGSEKIMK